MGTLYLPSIQSRLDKAKLGVRRTDKKVRVWAQTPDQEGVKSKLAAAKKANDDPARLTWPVSSATEEQAKMDVFPGFNVLLTYEDLAVANLITHTGKGEYKLMEPWPEVLENIEVFKENKEDANNEFKYGKIFFEETGKLVPYLIVPPE